MAGESERKSSVGPRRPVTAEEVAAYLKAHPDFFAQRPELLESLLPARPDLGGGVGGGVVDLQRFMIEKARGEAARLRETQAELVAAARANMRNQERIHEAALHLLEARSFDGLIHAVLADLAPTIDVDVVALAVEASAPDAIPHVHASGVRVVEPGLIDLWIGGRGVALRDDVQGDPELYGPAAPLVRSEALVRLEVGPDAPLGLLALGSRDPQGFHPGQATDHLAFLAGVIARCIRAWLDLPDDPQADEDEA